ncbi:MAG: MFS transporter [Humibacter sp.]
MSAAPVSLAPRYRHNYLILAICCMSLLIVSMDSMAINVALPSIRADFGSSVSALQWTIDAYTMVLASFLILSGSTADRIGRRRTFQLGLAIFTLGSLLCSIAPGVGWLIGFRMLQAFGGSMLNPVAMSIITATFVHPAKRARAVGVWSAVVGVSMAIGPLVGGALTDTVGWRGIFWINVPIGIAAIVLTFLFVPESRSGRRRRLDPFAQLLIIAMLGGLVAGLIEGPHLGWTNPLTIGLFALFVGALVTFILWERRRTEPLIDLRFFRSIPFSSAIVTAVAGYASNGGFLFLITLYLQDVRHLSAFDAGLHTLPMAGAQICFSNVSGRLVASRGPRLPLLLSSSVLGLAAVILTTLSPTTPTMVLLTVFLIYGIGQGLLNAPITTTAVSGMPPSQSGSAAGVTSTARQVGTSLGVALAGTLTGIGASTETGPEFTDYTHRMWWTMLGLMALVFALALLANSSIGQRSRERIAHLLEEPAERQTAKVTRRDASGTTVSPGEAVSQRPSAGGAHTPGHTSTDPG